MKLQKIVTHEELIEKEERWINNGGDDFTMELIGLMNECCMNAYFLFAGQKGKSIVSKMLLEFYKVYSGKKKKIDLVQFLNNCVKNDRYSLDRFFWYNLYEVDFKTSCELNTLEYVYEQDNIISYLKDLEFDNKRTIEFDKFFFKEYREFFVECFTSVEFIDILYSDSKKEIHNTIDSIHKAAFINHNIIKYNSELIEYFESESMQEEINRRMALGLEGCTNYYEILSDVLYKYNIDDFNIDVNGNLIYSKNEFFYKRCEELISVIEK